MKRVLTGIKPTNRLHIGNYFGSILNIKKIPNCQNFLFVADLHSLTTTIPHRKDAINIIKTYLAVLSDKHEYYIQSDFSQVCEISWYLSCICPSGQLNRMTQFKSQTNEVNSGYLFYPLLMAADILGIKADIVAVGEDQKQHIELARDLAGFFNKKYNSHVFIEPQPTITQGCRIKNLQDINKKMSKTEGSEIGTIFLDDSADEISKKVLRAQTDNFPMPENINSIKKERPQIYNLCEIFSLSTDYTFEQIEKNYGGKYISDFKNDLKQAIIQLVEPIKEFCQTTPDIEIENLLLRKQPKINQIFNDCLKSIRSILIT